MDHLVNVLLAMDRARTGPHGVLDCGPGLYGLNQVYWSNHPIPPV